MIWFRFLFLIKFQGLFNAKAIHVEQQWYYLTRSFPKGISLKVNIIARLEFELAFFEAAVPHFSHNTQQKYEII